MQLHDIKSPKGIKSKKRVGRGGKRGTYSGRGMKGQKARAGRRIRPQLRDILKKLPKKRGYGKHRSRSTVGSRMKPQAINILDLEKNFKAGEVISPEILAKKKMVRRVSGKAPQVKILGRGSITKALVFKDLDFSKSAREAVVKAGGKVQAD
ncbi:50S ribosomal protein L15 [Candidatus Giovannonibacteria bacterium]|nr:50S ribosomal protein L15 [Candidatus Giovannonibacteria bacterium]